MVVIGSATLARSLLCAELVDAPILLVYPLDLWRGKRLFQTLETQFTLRLTRWRAFEGGIVMLRYVRPD